MLTRVIPEFKLSKESVLADIDFIKGLGVEIRTNSPVGRSLPIEELLKKHQAVLAAVGSWTPTALKVPGSDLGGVHYALPLLEDIKQGKAISLKGRALIIGGGNTAMDMARAAVRLGAGEVRVVCLGRSIKSEAHLGVESALREGVQIIPLAPRKSRRVRKAGGAKIPERWRLFIRIKMEPLLGPQEGVSFLDADAVIIAIGRPSDFFLGRK
jgi:NADPH-dependent glutamate synthase beta subunit-like oxidoreductase